MARERFGKEVAGTYYYFLGKEDVYTALASELGWTKNGGGNGPKQRFSGSAYSAHRQRVTVSGTRTTATAAGSKRFSAQLWCATGELEEALAQLPGKAYPGMGQIESAYIQSGSFQVS
jgi:hypothetical protein